jgi:phage tail-like protein
MSDVTATPASGVAPEPYPSYNFKLVIQGVEAGHFTHCSGLGVRVNAIRYREGGVSQVVRRLPGQVEYADVVLQYGLTSSRQLWDWMMTAVSGKVERKNVSVLQLDTDGATEVVRWDLINAWPSEWRGAPLDALAQEVAIETLVLVFDSLDRG